MSTSLLYHGFGVRDYRHVRTRYMAGGVVLVIERNPQTYRCVACGSQNVWRHGLVVRRFRTVPARQQTGGTGGQDPAAGLPGLRPGAPGGGRLRRAETDLHQVVCTLRVGAVAAHDDQGRGLSPGRQLGTWSRKSRRSPSSGASTSRSSSTSSRSPSTRFPRQGPQVRDHRSGPRKRRGSPCGPGKRR